ncbi:MAG: hypothetical protein Fur0020_15580 [Thermodesulfovibrionia bacterium]
MSQGLAAFIMMNNYFHDVATAMIGASGVVMWLILKVYTGGVDKKNLERILWLYKWMKRILIFSVAWLIIGAFPRFLTYKTYEWANAVRKGMVIALMIKYVIALLMIVAGSVIWMIVMRRVKEIKDYQ